MTPSTDTAELRALARPLTRPPADGEVPNLDLLRRLLAAYPRRPWWLDAVHDPEHNDTDIRGIVAPSTPDEIDAGADPVYEVGDLYPTAANALAVAAVNALPWLLDELDRLTATIAGLNVPADLVDQVVQIVESYGPDGCMFGQLLDELRRRGLIHERNRTQVYRWLSAAGDRIYRPFGAGEKLVAVPAETAAGETPAP